MQLAMLCNRPNAWRNSLVRDMLPDPLREWLDLYVNPLLSLFDDLEPCFSQLYTTGFNGL